MVKFFTGFVFHPTKTGAIASSSESLSELITDTANLSNAKCVVELGPGTGVFTRKILERIPDKCIFFSLEVNPVFVKETRKNCPGAKVYQASAKEIKRYLHKNNKNYCDCVISGLPWAAFPAKQQNMIMHKIYDALPSGGKFLTFAYLHGLFLPTGVKFKCLLKEIFSEVYKTKIIWKNMPPAFVYYCKK